MTSENIYEILQSKPHNPHHLKRYLDLILYAKTIQSDGYHEIHHIAPKSLDLFPEYADFSENPWNQISLPYRLHFLAHRILWKAYGGRMTWAFNAMNNGQASGVQQRNILKCLPSKTAARLKEDSAAICREAFSGYAVARLENGETVRVTTEEFSKMGYKGNRRGMAKIKNRFTGERVDVSLQESEKMKLEQPDTWFPACSKILYFTPLGVSSNSQTWPGDKNRRKYLGNYSIYCLSPDLILTEDRYNIIRHKNTPGAIFFKSDIGKTFRELGFYHERFDF